MKDSQDAEDGLASDLALKWFLTSAQIVLDTNNMLDKKTRRRADMRKGGRRRQGLINSTMPQKSGPEYQKRDSSMEDLKSPISHSIALSVFKNLDESHYEMV